MLTEKYHLMLHEPILTFSEKQTSPTARTVLTEHTLRAPAADPEVQESPAKRQPPCE